MRVAVVGDVLLDQDIIGTSTRVAPDSGAPVLDVEQVSERPGGAGLVAALLARDGHAVSLVTALSADRAGARLRRLLTGVRVVAGPASAPTAVKTRLKSGESYLVRVDDGCTLPPSAAVTTQMLTAIADADAVVVADYGRGLTQARQLRSLLSERADTRPLVWDPHPRGSQPVAAAVVTPNAAEVAGVLGLQSAPERGTAAAAAEALAARWRTDRVAITLGAQGAWVRDGDRSTHLDAGRLPAHTDTCGAGDRLSGALSVALAEGRPFVDSVRTAISRTGEFLAAGGVSLLARSAGAERPVWIGDRHPVAVAAQVRRAGGRLVATGGCFDLLHAGHVRTLQAARAMGDALIVCLNSDASVRRLKGSGRPLRSLDERVEVLTALACVDAVAVFDEDSPERLLTQLRPDLWVKGGDYVAEALPEAALVQTWGGRCVTVPYHEGRSTTALVAALADLA